MAEAEYKNVRVEESLRVKIGEAKNLPASSFSGSGRNTCCAIKIDSEEIFRTSTVEKSTNPFFGAEFQGEIPKKFRFLSFYIYEVGNKNKVLGKVSLKKEELYKYHQKEHWFPLTYQDSDIEVQGKVQIEVKLDEFLTPTAEMSHRMTVRVLECGDLTVINGACNPYAVVTLSYGKTKAKEVKKTAVKKKTICPQFDETFSFYKEIVGRDSSSKSSMSQNEDYLSNLSMSIEIDNKGQSQEKNLYAFEDFMAGELSVSLFHDDSKVSREVLGNIFKGAFLGEVKIPIHDLDISRPHKAWYCLQAKEQNRTSDQSLGSIRLRISYTADYVFPSKYYDGLRNLVLESAETKPFTSSAVFILGEIVSHRENVVRENAAQPLVKLFLHHGKLVPLVHALADWEMSCTIDPNTLFRGNSLLTKMVDELMKIVGMPYLQDTLKSFIDQVVSEAKPCEIDPSRLRDGEDAETDLGNLFTYVRDAVNTIVSSGLVCPPIMRDVFSMLKSQAMLNYPDNTAVRYHAVTSFIFLRFFTAAIMGPNLFDLYSDILDPPVQRTFTLISKGISGLVTLVSSKSNNVTAKEEYMAPLFEMFPKSTQTDIKMFLDIISSSSGPSFKGIEAPIILKEGFLIKRAQGRKRFGLKNFKKRFFRLSNQSFSYSKNKGDKHYLFEIPITDILAVERLEEESFKMKYMFQVVHAERALYIQANNCVEEKEWLDILAKICKSNKNRLKFYHPAAFVNNHWLCCKSPEHSFLGCTPVTGDLPLCDILGEAGEVDSDREVEKIHSIFLSAIELLDALQEMCGSQAVYSGDTEIRNTGLGSNIEDPSSCFATIAEIQRCIITLEQEHIQYMRSVQRRTVIGSIDTPIGDESNADLVRNMNRSSERLSRHGSRSSNASNISRRSFRGCRSRGGSFREREKGKTEGEGVRKSLSGDVAACSHSLGVDFAREVKKAASYDVMTIDSRDGGSDKRTSSGDGTKSTDGNVVDGHVHRSYIGTNTSSRGTDSGIKDCSASSPTDLILSATDSDVFTSPEVRGPKTSTGFIPSAFPYSDDHIASFNYVNSVPRCSFECISITPDIRVGHPHSDSDLTHFSSSSHHSGVLETSLDNNNVITTTININDAQPAAQHLAYGRWAGSDLSQASSEQISHISEHTGSHIDVSVGCISDPSLTDITGVVEKEQTILPTHSQASSLCCDFNLDVSVSISPDATLKESSKVQIEYSTGGSNCVQNHTVLPRIEFNQNRSHTEQDSQCLDSMPGQSYMSNTEHFITEPLDLVECQQLSTDLKSAPENHIAKAQSVFETNQATKALLEQAVKEQSSLDNRNQQNVIGFCREFSVEKRRISGNTKEPVEYTEIDSHNVANGCSSLEENYTQQGPSFTSTQNEAVRYSVPELTSSCRSHLSSTDPQLSGSVIAIDSSSSTPAVSPSDVAVLEMLTSSESNSSQDKL